MTITSKKINLKQLDNELGSQGLSANFEDDKKKIIITSDNSTVTDEELESAIAAHVAGPTQDEIIQLNREEGLAKLKELGFTDEQIKALIG
jgi:hypothetical protein